MLCLAALMVSCVPKAQNPNDTTKPSPPPFVTVEITPQPTEDLTGKVVDPLTGLWVSESVAAARPVAVVYNNHHKALPQSGLAQASLYYEVIAEGNITRVVAVFNDLQSAKIGPIRSTRHYFLDLALDYDAVFVHHGGSPQGYEAIRRLNVDHVDGMADDKAFWRDPVRSKQPGMFEHSSYSDAQRIRDAIERYEYQPTLTRKHNLGFAFETTTLAQGLRAVNITVPFSEGYTAFFSYDSKQKKYLKFHEDGPHIDEETEEQLAVTNLIVQHAPIEIIAGDDAGRRDVRLVGAGSGYLFTLGKTVPIEWEKKSHETPTRWSFPDGKPLTLNPGKTWICIVSPETELMINENNE
jgi:hypothetical protein